MNKKEVIQRVRNHLRGQGYKLSEEELYILPSHYSWCITFIMDSLCVLKGKAQEMMTKEVLSGIKLLNKPKKENYSKVPYGYTTVRELSERTGIPQGTIMDAIYANKLKAEKKNGRWIILAEEATSYTINYNRKNRRKAV